VEFGRLQRRIHKAGHSVRHAVLKLEDVLHAVLEPVGPDLLAFEAVEQLDVDTYPIARSPEAAFDQVADAQLAADLGRVAGSAAVGQAG